MSKSRVQVSVAIKKPSNVVIDFIADVRNRAKYLRSLKAITDIVEIPGVIGTTWQWEWDFLGTTFAGVGKCVEYVPGQRYVFVTTGAIESKFTYHVADIADGCRLDIDVEFEVPPELLKHASQDQLLAVAHQKGSEAVQSLKGILE